MATRRKWSYRSYGRTATRQGVSLQAAGIEEYLQRIAQLGKDVDEAVKMAVNESAEIIYDAMRKGAEQHIRTAAVYDAIELIPATQSGNEISAAVGIDTVKHPQAIHGVFQEYGSPHFPADPFIRPAFDNNKSKAKKKQREVLIREGMPLD